MASPDPYFSSFRSSASESVIPPTTLPTGPPAPAAGLTEERLRDHNLQTGYGSGSVPSPYYLGSHGLRPGRESETSARSLSSAIAGRIQLWGSAFLSSRRRDGAPPLGFPANGAGEPGSDDWKSLSESEAAAGSAAAAGEKGKGKGKDLRGEIKGGHKEREFVWAHRYRPRSLKEFICNKDRAEELHRMVKMGVCNHFIFEGPPGVGKKTMILAQLRDSFGPEKLRMRNELKKIELKGESVASIDLNVRRSYQHVEVNLSETRGYEKHVIVALMNEFPMPSDEPIDCDQTDCRAIVLHEADKISNDSQPYVRWLMDKYKGCNKFFFCCSDASKLQPIKHLCKIIKLLPPSEDEIIDVLKFIAEREGIGLPYRLAKRVAENSKNNLRQAIRSFEATWKSTYQLEENQDILTGWEVDIANIAKSIVEEQSPRQLYIIRGKLKLLIEHDVSPSFIFNTLISELKNNLDNHFHPKIDSLYQEYNIWDKQLISNDVKCLAFTLDKREDSGKTLNDHKRNIQHFMRIEEFTAKFMSLFKSSITKDSTGTTDKSPGAPPMA